MRPLELRLRNFRSYAGEHVFDFRDRSLVGIVGPIGSGKSSILDAVAFGLYGRTPRIGSATRTLINQRAADGAVSLRFEVEGEIWEAARSIRTKGQSKHALYRYEIDEPDAPPVEKLVTESDVNERVVALLGLDFAAFERSVLLAQGRFAEFLQARPVDRDKVLKGVFGHDRLDRMKTIAKERRDQASHRHEKLAVRLERFDEIRARLANSRVEHKQVTARRKELEKGAEQLRRLEAEVADASAELTKATSRLAALEEHAGRLPDPKATHRSLDDAAAAGERRTGLAVSLDEAQRALATAEKGLAAANEAGEPATIERATRLLAAADPQLKAVVEADRRIASFAALVTKAGEGVQAARRGLEEAATTRDNALGRAAEAARILEEAEAALGREQHTDMAATLRSGLVVDESCPVCDQVVHELPESYAATHLEELQEVVVSARSTKREIDDAHAAALGVYERAKEQLQAAHDKEEAAKQQLAGGQDDAVRIRGDLEETTLQLEKILGPGDPAEHLEKRRASYEDLVSQRESAQRRVDQVRSRHDQAIRDEQEAAKALQELGLRLAELAGRLEVAITPGEELESLRAAFDQLRAGWTQATAELREACTRGKANVATAEEKFAELLRTLEVDGDVNAAIAVAEDRIERLAAAIERDEHELAQAADLYAEREQLSADVELFGRINSDLTDSRFVRFLLDEERARLAELGSEHFQQLSAGRYRFADDQFAIVDLTAADATRRADSLSGGETFLASLGLALALAEMVAGTGGRLDAFFLDEGFGTLDPEHLDLAMEGIERLVASDGDRLVVIVSHVPELRMRLEDLIELERNPVTGDTRVVRS
jgi:exonuclease SbcC